MDWGQLVEDLSQASPVTLLFLTVAVNILLKLTAPLYRALAPYVSKQTAARRDSAPAGALGPDAVQPAKQPGKSLKQLLKESKRAAAVGTGHEKLPDSPFILNSLRGHGDAVLSVDISPDDGYIATACADQVVRIYNMKGDFAAPAPGLTRQVLKYCPIGAAFWGSSDTTAACVTGLGQVADFVVTRTERSKAGPRDAVVSQQGKVHGEVEAVQMAAAATSGGNRPLMATMTKRKDVRVLTGAGTVLAAVEPNGIENYQVVLSKDGRFLAVTTWGSDVKLWEIAFARDGSFRGCSKAMELKGHRSGVLSIAFNADSSRAVTASKDGTLRIWRIDVRYQLQEDPKCIVNTVLEGGQPYSHMAWCANGVIVGAVGSDLHYIDPASAKVVERVPGAHDKRITALRATGGCVQCGGAGRDCAVVSGGADGRARVWAVPKEVLQ